MEHSKELLSNASTADLHALYKFSIEQMENYEQSIKFYRQRELQVQLNMLPAIFLKTTNRVEDWEKSKEYFEACAIQLKEEIDFRLHAIFPL